MDTALVLAVDVSGSVDDGRFVLQMEGIARAFEDIEVQRTILSGRYGALLVTLVNWSHKPQIAVPWTIIASPADAANFATEIRSAPRTNEDFTCMSLMMQVVADKVLPLMPVPADRKIVDVSGDGRDNCNPSIPVDVVRDDLVNADVTINGLPIREGKEAETIESWYEQHVIGGIAAFILPANGFQDFGRAIRQKFILEISGRDHHLDATAAGAAHAGPGRHCGCAEKRLACPAVQTQRAGYGASHLGRRDAEPADCRQVRRGPQPGDRALPRPQTTPAAVSRG